MVTTGGDPGLVYNTVNALAAAALTTCMGVAMDDIRQGLETMTQDENPGRGNLYSINGFTVANRLRPQSRSDRRLAEQWAGEGDIVVMLALERTAELHDRLKSLSKT